LTGWCGKYSPANFIVLIGFMDKVPRPLDGIYCQSLELYGEDLMRVQIYDKWCREFEKCRKGFHHNDRTGQCNTSRTERNAADWFCVYVWGGEEGGRDLRVTFRDLSAELVLSIISLHNSVHESNSPSLHCAGIFKPASEWTKCMIVAGKFVEIKRHAVSRQWKIGLYRVFHDIRA
jgi:hypothetical protein